MTDISPIGRTQSALFRTTGAKRVLASAQSMPTSGDRVEVSDHARLLSKLNELPDVRQDLVDRVRAEIAAGTYDTDEKIDALMDELIDDLTSEPL